MRCFDIYFYSLSTARFYCLPTFFCPIIKESKLFQSCIRMKDPMGYIASLLCQKFKDHVWSFSIDVIYLLSLSKMNVSSYETCFISDHVLERLPHSHGMLEILMASVPVCFQSKLNIINVLWQM